ncbi:uncharacterized protein EAF01_004093 [Botrytis porri]|uniref:uncharacterized protein n=1 Tax=Botrytis porri TaxID=87229 RepID=UPI001902AAE6|nr:uncharacterized protein EAF01_004093 [Botrytis porri]KAF7908338.1 hypothetical protein EAF01_004093 [Botrytis porri]
MCVYYTDLCPRGDITLIHTTACRNAHRRKKYCELGDQTAHNRCQRKLMSTESCPVCHDLRYPAVRPGGDEIDGDGDGDGDGDDGDGEDDDDDNDDDDSGSRKRKIARIGASKQSSLTAMLAEKRNRVPKIIAPRKRATNNTRKRGPDNQKDFSRNALLAQAEGRQQYPLRPKISYMDSRIKAEKVARDRSSRDEYEEDEEF